MEPLLQFLESLIGPSSKGSGSNYKFVCPLPSCSGKDSKIRGDKKFEINLATEDLKTGKPVNNWHCWICDNKGRSVHSLLKALNLGEQYFQQLNDILKYSDFTTYEKRDKQSFNGNLPKEFKSLSGKIPKQDLKARHAKVYLKNRHITEDDILKYNIGYCEEGTYSDRIIIPIYNDLGKIVYFVARAISEEVRPKYKYPETSKDFIPNEMYLNMTEPLVICEGIFDAISIKRNAVPLLGKVIQPELMKKLIASDCKKVYLALDPDAVKEFVKYAELLLNEGKQVYTIDFQGYKDANEMGFELFTKTIQKAEKLTMSKLLKLKINLK